MRSDRGFTLLEVLICVGLVVLIAAGAVGATLSSRSLAVTSAAAGVDSLLDAARTTARQFRGGATLAFTPDAYGDGFVARLFENRPGVDTLTATTTPAVEARVAVTESEALGTPAFAIAIHANGKVSGFQGDILAGTPSEIVCPASGRFHLAFAYAGFMATRDIPCRIDLATTGPVVFVTPIPTTPQPSPSINVCSGAACVPLPTSPSPNATCPPGYAYGAATSSCVPAGSAPPSTPTPRTGLLPPLFICDPHNPPAPYDTDLGPDPDGIHEDYSNQTWCGATAPPTAAPSQPRLVEAQIWIAYNGSQSVGEVEVDREIFFLLDDGSSSVGAPTVGWSCAVRTVTSAPSEGASWGGFILSTSPASPASPLISTRYGQLYQKANDTGGDGRLIGTDELC